MAAWPASQGPSAAGTRNRDVPSAFGPSRVTFVCWVRTPFVFLVHWLPGLSRGGWWDLSGRLFPSGRGCCRAPVHTGGLPSGGHASTMQTCGSGLQIGTHASGAPAPTSPRVTRFSSRYLPGKGIPLCQLYSRLTELLHLVVSSLRMALNLQIASGKTETSVRGDCLVQVRGIPVHGQGGVLVGHRRRVPWEAPAACLFPENASPPALREGLFFPGLYC